MAERSEVMSEPPPTWRRIYDEVERTVAPRVEGLIRSETFQRKYSRAKYVRRSVRRRLGGLTSRAWHLVNLPAGTDLTRLAGQLGALDREVRKLSLEVEAQNRSARDGKDGDRAERPEPDGPAG